ncbi:uncharacterized protein [Temnothorax nylanderi]|uniref:uncharacterized protein n=1 Tax=Temnothorax nylanderi TaxID=102681 RepID=UPI003A8ABF00
MALAGSDLPQVPNPLKSIQKYLTVALKHDQRDNVVSYWCRLYALQTELKLSTKTSAETNFLLKLTDWLEATKKELHDNEVITNYVAAQSHLENWALKLFLYADKNDRAANFSKNVLQSFYTAQILYEVLTLFGELSVEAVQNRKYVQWKAAYLNNCFTNGETPVPGPMKEADDDSTSINAHRRSSHCCSEKRISQKKTIYEAKEDDICSSDISVPPDTTGIVASPSNTATVAGPSRTATAAGSSRTATAAGSSSTAAAAGPSSAAAAANPSSISTAAGPSSTSVSVGPLSIVTAAGSFRVSPLLPAPFEILYDVLTLFGELSVEVAQNRKYAQWKAAYLNNCFTNGETLVPGPMKEADDDSTSINASNDNDDEPESSVNLGSPKDNTLLDIPSVPANLPTTRTQWFESEDDGYKTESGAKLTVEQISKVQKMIKWASSTLDYDDVATSVMNLRKALHLLTTGQESA